MSVADIHVPRDYRLSVQPHFLEIDGSSKRTGLVTAALRRDAVRTTGPEETDVYLVVTGQDRKVETLLRAVVGTLQ